MNAEEMLKVLKNVHDPRNCEGRGCPLHHPSDHKMKDWPLYWRDDRGLMERTCEHGIGHPDPDDIAYKATLFSASWVRAEEVHGCDGCCG